MCGNLRCWRKRSVCASKNRCWFLSRKGSGRVIRMRELALGADDALRAIWGGGTHAWTCVEASIDTHTKLKRTVVIARITRQSTCEDSVDECTSLEQDTKHHEAKIWFALLRIAGLLGQIPAQIPHLSFLTYPQFYSKSLQLSINRYQPTGSLCHKCLPHMSSY